MLSEEGQRNVLLVVIPGQKLIDAQSNYDIALFICASLITITVQENIGLLNVLV